MSTTAVNVLPDGSTNLSEEALVRLDRRRSATDAELPVPDLSDPRAVAQWRIDQHRAWGEDVLPDEVPHQEIVAGGVRSLWAGAAFDAKEPTPVVVYLHGGGFCLGSPGTAAPITARLARSDGGPRLTVVSVDYRLAPEHPFPAALDDAERVIAALLAGRRIVLAGDSAGANLAFGLWQRLGSDAVAGIIGLCPVLDLRPAVAPSVETAGFDLIRAYVGRTDPSDSSVSPLAMTDQQLAALPPVLLQSTTGDDLHAQAAAFTRRVEAVGGAIEHQVWHGLWHAWHYHRELPEAHLAVDLAADTVHRWTVQRWSAQGSTAVQR